MAPTLHVGVRTLVGSVGQPLAFFNASSVFSDNRNSDVARLSVRDATRLLAQDSVELQIHDQLFGSLVGTAPAMPGLRSAIMARKFVSDAKPIPGLEEADLLEEDLVEALALARLAAQ